MYAPDTAAVATSIGLIVIDGDEDRIDAIHLSPAGPARVGKANAVREAADQIAAYFSGTLHRFDLPLAPSSTPRGGALRQAIVDIGYGRTASYGDLARIIGSSARALGQACARNRFPLVVPCHRVLRAGGVLGTYSAGDGPATKRWLLEWEAQRGSPATSG